MEYVNRVVRSVMFRYLMVASLILAFLYIMTLPIVVDPLIAFLLAGIVPGTEIVLSPEIVLIGLLNILGLMTICLLIGWLVRRRRIHEVLLDIAAASEPEIRDGLLARSAHKAQAISAIRQLRTASGRAARFGASKPAKPLARRTATRAVDYPVLFVLRRGFEIYSLYVWRITMTLYRGILLLLAALFYGFRQLVRLTRRTAILCVIGLRSIAVVCGKCVIWAAVFLIVLLGTVIDYGLRLGKMIWRRSLPYLRRFDSKLEIMTRYGIDRIARAARRVEWLQVFIAICRNGLTNVRHLFRVK